MDSNYIYIYVLILNDTKLVFVGPFTIYRNNESGFLNAEEVK